MKLKESVIVPAYDARCVKVMKGEFVQLIDIEGQQVGDLIAYKIDDTTEHSSPAHTRCALKNVYLKLGDCLYSNRRKPLMKLVEDSVGAHDLLYPECDTTRYNVELGVEGFHRNCYDNLMGELRKLGIRPQELPEPLNVFMNVPVLEDGSIAIELPKSKAGDYMVFEALEDLYVLMSSCSNDVPTMKTNAGKITDMRMEVYTED